MTTVTQAEAYLRRGTANASPFSVVVTVHLHSGGDPTAATAGNKRYYRVDLVVQYGDDLFLVKSLQNWSATRPAAVMAAKAAAIKEGLNYRAGLWSDWGSSHREMIRLDV